MTFYLKQEKIASDLINIYRIHNDRWRVIKSTYGYNVNKTGPMEGFELFCAQGETWNYIWNVLTEGEAFVELL